MNDIKFLDMNDPEWEKAWNRLGELEGNGDKEAHNPVYGESWQYLGSFPYKRRWMHEFRHRMHPVLQRRTVKHVLATEGWSPNP